MTDTVSVSLEGPFADELEDAEWDSVRDRAKAAFDDTVRAFRDFGFAIQGDIKLNGQSVYSASDVPDDDLTAVEDDRRAYVRGIAAAAAARPEAVDPAWNVGGELAPGLEAANRGD